MRKFRVTKERLYTKRKRASGVKKGDRPAKKHRETERWHKGKVENGPQLQPGSRKPQPQGKLGSPVTTDE
jgi:hypothetical protein